LGTALKPATEHWILARKPLTGTVAANVAEHGTGALNVDGCRVESADDYTKNTVTQGVNTARTSYAPAVAPRTFEPSSVGRWPPNLLLTHSADCGEECAEGCPVRELDEQSGEAGSRDFREITVPGRRASPQGGGFYNIGAPSGDSMPNAPTFADTGGASRFFPRFRYEAKASSAERNAGLEGMPETEAAAPRVANHHPTVKPVALMRWLCRLVTPPGGLILDPFLGSGGDRATAGGRGHAAFQSEPRRMTAPLQTAFQRGGGGRATVPADWRSYAELRPSLVARISGRSLRAIRRKIERGELPSRKVDGCRLVPVRAVLELVGEVPGTAAAPAPTVRARADEILSHFRGRHG
jgi:hypothetical protein